MPDFDVAIIGGGLVGASLAAALRTTSMKIALVESRAFPTSPLEDDYDERSIALSYQSKKILQGLGLWDELESHAAPMKSVHVSEKGRFGATRLNAADVGTEALGYVVMYRHLMIASQNALKQQKSLRRYIPASLKRFKPVKDAVSLTIEHADGKEEVITTRLLVGADGGQSSTRDLLKIPSKKTDYQQQAIVANIGVSGGLQTEAYERFTADGPLALLPLGEDRYALVWTGTVEKTAARMALDETEFLSLLQGEAGHRVGELEKLGKREIFPLHQLVAERITSRRTALVGNAAHLLHPVAGQGLNLALRDVAVLSELIANADDPGAQTILAQYTALRQKDIQITADSTYSLLQIFGFQSTLVSHLRGASLALLDKIPPLKNRLAREGMGFRKTLRGGLFSGNPVRGNPQ